MFTIKTADDKIRRSNDSLAGYHRGAKEKKKTKMKERYEWQEM